LYFSFTQAVYFYFRFDHAMTFILRNSQNVIKVNTHLLEKHVLLLRTLMNVSCYDLSVTCVDDDAVQNLNKTYRDTDEPTDVLAFPFLEVGKLLILNRIPILYVWCLIVFNATFNNISVISWRSVLLVVKTTDLSQVADKLVL
jgi:hypothetical protein